MTKPTNECAPSEDSDQPGHSPSLCAQLVAKDPNFLHADSKDLIRLDGCIAILLVLSCCGSFYVFIFKRVIKLSSWISVIGVTAIRGSQLNFNRYA